MADWLAQFSFWVSAHPQWLGLAIFTISFLECLAIAGLIVPGSTLLLAIATIAGGSQFNVVLMLFIAFIGGFLGDITSFVLGRYFQEKIPQLIVFKRHPSWLSNAEIYFKKYGIISLLIGRFFGPLRPVLPMVAGMAHMSYMQFIFISFISSIAWSVVYLLPGWFVGNNLI